MKKILGFTILLFLLVGCSNESSNNIRYIPNTNYDFSEVYSVKLDENDSAINVDSLQYFVDKGYEFQIIECYVSNDQVTYEINIDSYWIEYEFYSSHGLEKVDLSTMSLRSNKNGEYLIWDGAIPYAYMSILYSTQDSSTLRSMDEIYENFYDDFNSYILENIFYVSDRINQNIDKICLE